MSLNLQAILDVVTSHAMKSGYFDKVNNHEPKKAPNNGVTAAVWVDSIKPASSGLTSTSALVTLNVRIYQNMLAEPQDAIDPNIVAAADGLITAYSGDFELGGNARDVDLLGEYGDGVTAQAGYIEQDQKMYRVVTITLPVVVNDVWTQVA